MFETGEETKEQYIRRLCKQLYTIGFNDGKGNIKYYPKPYNYYADKIIKQLKKYAKLS